MSRKSAAEETAEWANHISRNRVTTDKPTVIAIAALDEAEQIIRERYEESQDRARGYLAGALWSLSQVKKQLRDFEDRKDHSG